MIKYFCIVIFVLITISCSEKTIYSGKILNQEKFKNINFENKENLIKIMGQPSFSDPLENKFFYFSKKEIKYSVFKNEISYSYIFIFKFNKNNEIIKSQVYDLKNTDKLKMIEEETSSEIVKRGLLERIFGGVGPNQELPTSP